MGTKLYPEIDHRALGQRYCDHVMAMTAEGLHDKSDIAGQLAWRDDQLAAKDREIAELRKHRDAAVTDYTRMQEIALQAESERDEARECVGRLCEVLQSIHDFADYGRLRDQAGDALAATPEHLRNA